MGLLNFIIGVKKRQVESFLKNGAIILDVRTQREVDKGMISGSKHIPLSELHLHVADLKALNKPFIVCCESGVRSAKAAKFLSLHNMEATNGGGWIALNNSL